MAGNSATMHAAVIDAYDFAGISTLVDVGVFRNPPVVQLSVEPTVSVPLIVGLPTGTGAWTIVAAETTRTLSGFEVATLPALSTASAVSTTVWPTLACVGK